MNCNIPGLGFTLVKLHVDRAPCRIGRQDSTMNVGGSYYSLVGPASLINTACEWCSNAKFQCSLRRVRTSNLLLAVEEVLVFYGFDEHRPDIKCPLCDLQLANNAWIHPQEFNQLPVLPDFVSSTEDIDDPDVRWGALERERNKQVRRLNTIRNAIRALETTVPIARRHK
jgi:hypothetical protein